MSLFSPELLQPASRLLLVEDDSVAVDALVLVGGSSRYRFVMCNAEICL